MSHQPERKEKDCLNCGTYVKGRYCQHCGQENIVSRQSFWSLVKHFVYDIFHFDGKFFDTLKYLFFRPGRVPADYVLGRRNSYLDPIRMYLFTSALFFLIFFSTQKFNTGLVSDTSRYMTKTERFQESARLFSQLTPSDSIAHRKVAMLLDTTKTIRIDLVQKNTIKDSSYRITLNELEYTMQPIADSGTLMVNKGDGYEQDWVSKNLESKWRAYKKQYGDDINSMLVDFTDRFVHWFPYILFVSLPFFAFILMLLYGRKKKYFYSDHAVFTLYHFIFSFLLILLIIGFEGLHKITGWRLFMILIGMLAFCWFVYLFISMKRFYKQGWLKTLLKFFALNILGFLSLLLIFIFFTFLFIFQL